MPTKAIMPAFELAQETGKVLRWLIHGSSMRCGTVNVTLSGLDLPPI
jgi:hypothetical protein